MEKTQYICEMQSYFLFQKIIFVLAALRCPVKPYKIMTNPIIFPLNLYDGDYCAICISTCSYAFWTPALLEHDQLQDKQQREDVIMCTHRR